MKDEPLDLTAERGLLVCSRKSRGNFFKRDRKRGWKKRRQDKIWPCDLPPVDPTLRRNCRTYIAVMEKHR